MWGILAAPDRRCRRPRERLCLPQPRRRRAAPAARCSSASARRRPKVAREVGLDGRSGRRRGDVRRHHSGARVAIPGELGVTSSTPDPIEARSRPGPKRPRRWRRTSRAARPRPRDDARPRTTSSSRSSSFPATACAADPVDARRRPALGRRRCAGEARELAALGIKAVLLFGIPAAKDPLGLESHAEDGVVQQAIRGAQGREPGARRHDRRLPVRVHGSRPLRAPRRRRLRPERRDARDPRPHRRLARARPGADVVAPSGMIDGMVGAIRAALDAEGLQRRRDPLLRGQVRVGVLRPVPRGRGGRARVRRPAVAPDGSGQRARGAARGRARRRGGRRRADGQARARLPRRRATRPRALPRAPAGRVQRQRRVRDGQGRCRERLARRARGRARGAHRRSAVPAPISSSRTTRRTLRRGCSSGA